MLLAHKALQEITEDDLLQRLVEASAQESETVEFTEEMWGNGADAKRDMLREIVAFANQRGGELYIGVRERDGAATELVGLNGEGIAERIQSSCAANFEQSLIGLGVHPVSLANGRSIVIVRVPLSLSAPHMITFQGLNQFWIRRGRQKGPMTVDEIEAAYTRRLDAETAAERFIASRISEHGSNRWAPDLRLYWSVTPLFLRNEILNPLDARIIQLVKEPPLHPQRWAQGALSSYRAYPSVRGVEAIELANNEWEKWRIEVHRTGHCELVVRNIFGRVEPDTEKKVRPVSLVGLGWRFFEMVKRIYEISSFSGPVLVTGALIEAVGATLSEEVGYDLHKLTDRIVTLPPLTCQDYASEIGPVFKRLADRMWNAFRLESCPFVNAEGGIVFGRG